MWSAGHTEAVPGRDQGYFIGPFIAHYADDLVRDMGLPDPAQEKYFRRVYVSVLAAALWDTGGRTAGTGVHAWLSSGFDWKKRSPGGKYAPGLLCRGNLRGEGCSAALEII